MIWHLYHGPFLYDLFRVGIDHEESDTTSSSQTFLPMITPKWAYTLPTQGNMVSRRLLPYWLCLAVAVQYHKWFSFG